MSGMVDEQAPHDPEAVGAGGAGAGTPAVEGVMVEGTEVVGADLDGLPFDVTDETFDAEVLGSTTPVLVDFWASWCGPCRQVAPVLEQIALERAGSLRVAKVDVDANPGLASRFGISSIPLIVRFENGEATGALLGARPKSTIESELLSA